MRNWKRAPYEPGHLSRGGRLDHTRLGSDHNCVRLTEEQVLLIRASDETNTKLAKQYGVSWSTIDRVRKRQTWKHL